MEKIEVELLEKVAEKNHFPVVTVEQVYWMKQILFEIQQTSVGKEFALMGGSAIAFLYGNIYRLSVDLDLDYIGNPNLGSDGDHEIEKLQSEHFDIIRLIATKLNLDVKQEHISGDKRYVQYKMLYKSLFGGTKTVDLDLSYRYCHSILEPVTVIFHDLIEGADFEVQTLAPEEIWASKIIATIGGERLDAPDGKLYLGGKRKIRHLFDCHYLAERMHKGNQDKIDLLLLQKLVFLMGLTRIKDFEFFRGEMITLYTDKEMTDELFPVIRKTKAPPILIELKRGVRKFLDNNIFIGLDPEIYEFFEDFASGNFRPKKLFEKEIADRLKAMYYYKVILDKVVKR